MNVTLTLSGLALALNARSGLFANDDTLAEAQAKLTGPAAKTAYAEKLLVDATSLFAIPAEAIPGLAARLADPATRDGVVADLYGFGYADPAIDWAGTGITLVMDRVFADRAENGKLHVVAIPAGWSVDLWSSDSDLTEDGRVYSHWVAASLPTAPADSYDEPMQFVLLSSEVSGTLRWGGHELSLYCGEVDITAERQNRMFWDLLSTQAAGRPV